MDHSIEIQRVDLPQKGLIMITYKPRRYFVKTGPSTNVTLSLFTTSAARLKLLDAMETVEACPGTKLLYTDTVIFCLYFHFLRQFFVSYGNFYDFYI